METRLYRYGNPWQLLHRKPVETHGHQRHGFPWVSTSYGNLWKPMETSMETHGNCCIGNPWKPMDTKHMGFHGFPHITETYGNLWTPLWKPMAIVASETRGNPWTPNTWVSMDCGNLWKPIDTCMETRGNLCIEWNPMETYGHLWKPMKTYGNFTTFPEVPLLVETSGNPW